MKPGAPSLQCELPAPVPGWSPVLGELMGLATLLVVLHTTQGMLGLSGSLHFELGVDILFVLVGAAFALRPPGPSGGSFPAARLGAVLPAYWIVLTLYAICNAHFLQLHYTPFNLALHYLGVQGWFGDSYGLALNGQFCLVSALLAFAAFQRWGRALAESPDRLLLAGAVLSVPIAGAFYFTGQSSSFGYLAQPLPGFFLGLLLGQLLRTGGVALRLGPPLALAALLLLYVPYTQGVLFNPPVAGLGLMGLYVLAWKRLAAPGLEKWTARLLRWVGGYWLEILLLHEPLVREYNYYFQGRWFGIGAPTPSNLAAGIAIGLALTLVLAVILRWLVQKISSFIPYSA